jgi:hypothetical protein
MASRNQSQRMIQKWTASLTTETRREVCRYVREDWEEAVQRRHNNNNTIAQAYNNVMSSTPVAARPLSRRLLDKKNKASSSEVVLEKDAAKSKSRKKSKTKGTPQQAGVDQAPEQQQQKDNNDTTNTATANTEKRDITHTSSATLTAKKPPKKTKKGSGKDTGKMRRANDPYSLDANDPGLSESDSEAVISLLGKSDEDQHTVTDVLTGITMEDYIDTNIDDVGMVSLNTWISNHTFTVRQSVNVRDKNKNSNLGQEESESSIRVNHRKYTENKWCQEKFGESPSFSFDLLGLI